MNTNPISEVLADMRKPNSNGRQPSAEQIEFADRIESALASAEPVACIDERHLHLLRQNWSQGNTLKHPKDAGDGDVLLYTHAQPAAKIEALGKDADDWRNASGLITPEMIGIALESNDAEVEEDHDSYEYRELIADRLNALISAAPTPASVPDYNYIIERIAASWDECMHVDSLDSVIDIGADIRDQWKQLVYDATNPAPASLEGFGPMPSPDLSGRTIRPATPEPTP